jgi:hypothetical protein
MQVYDAHVHCGPSLPFERIRGHWQKAHIDGGVTFSPVEEIYNRYDPSFTDSAQYALSRKRAHEYLLDLSRQERTFPYFFVWNDFTKIPEGFMGIKWHRHEQEPVYDYESPECAAIIEQICVRGLPIVLEEEFVNTLNFISRINGRTVIIIPHMGGLNGGYRKLRDHGVFDDPMIWVDTALADLHEIEDYTNRHGVERIMFGSDFPFGEPEMEREKVERLFSGQELESVLGRNLLNLMGKSDLLNGSDL